MTVLVALAQRSSSAVTGSADVPRGGRWPPRSLRVTQFFTPAGTAGVGEKQAGVHPQRRRGGRPRVRAPRVGTSRGSGGAPRRRPLALPRDVS